MPEFVNVFAWLVLQVRKAKELQKTFKRFIAC